MRIPSSPLRLVLALSVALSAGATAAAPPAPEPDLLAILANPALFDGVEAFLAGELQQRVAKADAWKVDLPRDDPELVSGKLKRVAIEGRNVRLPQGLVLPEMGITLEDIQLTLKPAGIESIGKSGFHARIDQQAINAFLAKRKISRLEDARVALRKDGEGIDRMAVSGKAVLPKDLLGIPVPQTLLGLDLAGTLHVPLEVVGEPKVSPAARNTIDFIVSEFAVGPVRLRKRLARLVEGQINPVVDLSSLKVPATLTGVNVKEGWLEVEGSLDFGKQPVRLDGG